MANRGTGHQYVTVDLLATKNGRVGESFCTPSWSR